MEAKQALEPPHPAPTALAGRPMDAAAGMSLFLGPAPAPPVPAAPSTSLTESLLMRLQAATCEGGPTQRACQAPLDAAAAITAAAINDAPVFIGTPMALPPLSLEALLGVGPAPVLFSPADGAPSLGPLGMAGGLGLTLLPGALPAGWLAPGPPPPGLRLPPSALGHYPNPSADTSHSIATHLERGGSVPNLAGVQAGQEHAARAGLLDEASAAPGHVSSDRLTALAPGAGADDGLDLDDLFRHFGGNTPRAGTVDGAAAAAALAAAVAVSPRALPGSPDLKQVYDMFVSDMESGIPPDLAARMVPQGAAAAVAAAATKASRATTPSVPRPQGLRAAPPKKRSYAEIEGGPATPEKLAYPGPAVQRQPPAAPPSSTTRNQSLVPQGSITALLPGAEGGPPLRPQRCHHLFGKVVTRSDVSKLGRIVLPRAGVEACFPPCHDRNGVPLAIHAPCGRRFDVVLKFWMNGRPVAKRMWLLDQCHEAIEGLGLAPGKQLDFFAAEDGRVVVKVTA